MRKLVWSIFVLLTAQDVAPAAAEVRVTAEYGKWAAMEGTNDDGDKTCSIVSALPQDRYFMISWYYPDTAFVVRAFKKSWRIPPSTQARVVLRFDAGITWSVAASGGRNIVEWSLRDDMERFFNEFSNSKAGVLEFPDGSELPWVMDLTGSAAASRHMAGCIGRVRGQEPTTQPFGPSQPFKQ